MALWQPSTLARYLFVAYVPLVVYASLYPFSGWRDRGLPPLAFLTAPFPRPIPVFDVVANIIGYMPLGFRALFKTPSGKLYPAEVFQRVEAGVACANGLAAGLLALCLTARNQPARAVVVIFLATALAVHSFGFGLVVSSQDVLAWVTPGALYGVAAAILLLLLAAGMSRTAQLALMGLALMAAMALVNLAPANPYMTASLALWRQGHFLNFNGATRVVSAVWPFAAMVYLVLLANDRGQVKE